MRRNSEWKEDALTQRSMKIDTFTIDLSSIPPLSTLLSLLPSFSFLCSCHPPSCPQLLDSFSIACVMVLSFIFLRTRYKVINFMGVLLSLIGIVSLVLADLEVSHLNQGRTAHNLSNTVETLNFSLLQLS